MKAEQIKVGDVIMPPAREVKLWMRRDVIERGLPESALYLTVTKVEEGAPDKAGRWLLFVANFSQAWNARNLPGVNPYPFRFKARPATEWIVIAPKEVAA